MVTLLYPVLHLHSVLSGCRYAGGRPEENMQNADIGGKAGRISRNRQFEDIWEMCELVFFPQFI